MEAGQTWPGRCKVFWAGPSPSIGIFMHDDAQGGTLCLNTQYAAKGQQQQSGKKGGSQEPSGRYTHVVLLSGKPVNTGMVWLKSPNVTRGVRVTRLEQISYLFIA